MLLASKRYVLPSFLQLTIPLLSVNVKLSLIVSVGFISHPKYGLVE
jgi:DNA-binding MltR family transcriptional regulator